MLNKSNYLVSKNSGFSSREQISPTTSHLAALKQLDHIVPGLEVQFDPCGEIRHLTMASSEGLVPRPTHNICGLLTKADPIALAQAFLKNTTIESLLGKQSQSLSLDCLNTFPFGYRVDFKQIAQIAGIDHALSVRGGALNIAINNSLQVFNLTSSLQYGSISALPTKIISESEAIKEAEISFAQPVARSQCQLMLAAHNSRLNAVYEVVLCGTRPENCILYLILAKTGKIVQKQGVIFRSANLNPELSHPNSPLSNNAQHGLFADRFAPADGGGGALHAPADFDDDAHGLASNCPRRGASHVPADTSKALLQERLTERSTQANILWVKPRNVPASALLQTPEPNKPIAKQVSNTIIKDLPNAKVLRNRYLVVLMGSKGKPVYARTDGSFCFRPSDPEFAAVTTFISLNSQIALYLDLGLKAPTRPLLVFVDDKEVLDNAYFSPNNYELHIGVGSGLRGNGLNKHMSFDLGIANHEFGHNVVYLQTPSHDLRGIQGSAIHEAIGDVLGTLVMNYLVKIWYAKQFGHGFTAADLKADQRIIGSYAAAPNGIRRQKNNKRMPDDFLAEPHADGLIVGGALADLLVVMATKPNTNLQDQIRLFVKIALMALALVPAYKVTFTDLLRALLTADQQITTGQYRQSIERCFARHGIALAASFIGAHRINALAA